MTPEETLKIAKEIWDNSNRILKESTTDHINDLETTLYMLAYQIDDEFQAKLYKKNVSEAEFIADCAELLILLVLYAGKRGTLLSLINSVLVHLQGLRNATQ